MDEDSMPMQGQRKHQARGERGNLYVLYIGLAAMIIVVWNLYACIGLTHLVHYRSKCALEAASLAAARDLSRIVVDDPKWGYVALTDHPPVGDDTKAEDGYPLPVTGINTIMATVRLELIVAESIGTNEAIDCAMEDVRSARIASRRLNRALRNSLKTRTGSPSGAASIAATQDRDLVAHDIYGKPVRPMDSARDVYRKNASHLLEGMGWNVESVTGELGYLTEEGTTNTPLPGTTAKIDPFQKNYPAFVDVPACGEEFYFAGLGKQPSLVETSLFETSRAAQNCSIVRLVAQLKKDDGVSYVKSVACAQPAYMEDKVPSSYMVLRFPNGIPTGTDSLRNLLTAQGMSNKIPLYTATGGDFPVDHGAQLAENPGKASATVRHTFTRAFFDWLRTAHAKPKLDGIMNALDCQFNRQHASNTYLFTFDDKGAIEVVAPQNYPFTAQTAYENQLYTVAFNAINANGVTWTMRLRDQVHRLGKQEGGKHAGQPMPSIAAVSQNQDEDKRLLATAGSRYDRSRLGLELEISSPTAVADGGNL
jgi:hypothetical protein